VEEQPFAGAVTVVTGAGRDIGAANDVARTAPWLASPESGYTTGKIVELDGGAERPVFPDPSPDLTAS
jgi:7-alpha-hydroxysteroid dehydrogenase